MAKDIPLGQIGDHMDQAIQQLVKAVTTEWHDRCVDKTPEDTGDLKRAWRLDITQPYRGEVTNNMAYAEPVCYGTNLPPSWKGQYRTRKNTVPGFPEIIGKELEPWAQREYQKIIRRG